MTTISEARLIAAKRAGISLKDGTPSAYSALSPADQIRLTDELALLILENQQDFTPAQIDIARRRVNSPIFGTPLASYGIGEMASDFVDEAGAQLAIIAEPVKSAGDALQWIGRNAPIITAAAGLIVIWPVIAPILGFAKQTARKTTRKK